MKNHSIKIFALSLLASLSLVSTAALADENQGSQNNNSIYVQETGLNIGQNLNLTLPIQSGASNYFAGSLNLSVGSSLNANGSISNATSFQAFCIDPFQWSSSLPLSYSAASLSSLGSTQATEVTKLYSQSFNSTLGNSQNSAAFQLALWELSKDDGSLSSGNVQKTNSTTSAVVTAANSMITNAKTGTMGNDQYAFNLYTNGNNQDYLVASVTAVPEPETYAMFLVGMGLISFTARRRRA
jgi:hypothetical protein